VNAAADGVFSRIVEVEAYAAPPSTNVALAANGGVASASSYFNDAYWGTFPPANGNNGDRKGTGGVIWMDNTFGYGAADSIEIAFNSTRTINKIDVVTRQDDLNNPIEPTPAQTFSLYGITAFEVQYWNGSSWVTVPNGSVSGNNKVWRQFVFPAVTTNKIRVVVTAGADNVFSRVVEVEAWTDTSSTANINWLVADQLGTPRMIFDKTGALATTKRHDYLPFGEELLASVGLRNSNNNTLGYALGDGVRQKFTQKERDVETGLDYFGARYYSSTQGRFASTDPITMTVNRLHDPQQINLYAYCRNNPLVFIDPTGEKIAYKNKDSEAAYNEYVTYLQNCGKKCEQELATVVQLKDSDVTYVINLAEKAGSGEGELTTDGDKIFININNVGGAAGETFSRNSRFAHELEHGRQFDSGELSFNKDEKTGEWRASSTYDIGDEVKAFTAQMHVSVGSDYWADKGGGGTRKPSLLRDFANAKTDDERAGVLSRSAYPGRNQTRDSNVRFSPSEGYKPGQLIRPTDRPGYFGRVHSP
jgi:RHS repeat-associated protein